MDMGILAPIIAQLILKAMSNGMTFVALFDELERSGELTDEQRTQIQQTLDARVAAWNRAP